MCDVSIGISTSNQIHPNNRYLWGKSCKKCIYYDSRTAEIRKSSGNKFSLIHSDLLQVLKEGTIIRVEMDCNAKNVSFFHDDVLLGTVDMATFLFLLLLRTRASGALRAL